MERVSMRTLTLLLVLLLAIVSHQYLAMTRPCTTTIWLAGDLSTSEQR